MKSSLKEALEVVDETYDELHEIAKKIISEYSEEVDDIIKKANSVKDMSDAQIRNLITLLSLKSYSLSEAKENSIMKLACAVAERKSKYSEAYKKAEGTQGDKNSEAQSETVFETLAESVYDLVASMLKSKIDEVHRIVDALKSNLMSRMAEAKLVAAEKGNRAAYED